MFDTDTRKLLMASAGSGVLLVLSFPNFSYYLLAFVALVPLLVTLYGRSLRSAFVAGFSMGMVFFTGTNYWIYHSGYHFGGIPLWESLLLVLLLAAYLSLYTGIFAMLYAFKMNRTSTMPSAFIAPVFWVLVEYVRSHALTGFPYGLLGYSQSASLTFIQSADLGGVYMTSLLVVAINGAIADLVLMPRRRMDMPLFSIITYLVAFGLLGMVLTANFIYGKYRLAQERPGAAATVAIIQGNIEQSMKWDPENARYVFNTYLSMTRTAAEKHPDLVVWPETAVQFYYGFHEEPTAALNKFVFDELRRPLLFGTVTVKSRKEPYELANSAVMVGIAGKSNYTYDKIHLVPFGEYVPLKRVLSFVNRLAAGIGDYAPGTQYTLGKTEFGQFATLICYEIIFPDLVRRFFRKDGEFMVTVTNDAWFGTTAGLAQNFGMSVFRAVENRKPLIRAANTGISGFIDSSGRVVERSNINTREILVKVIRTDSTRTLYTRYGDILPFFCIITGMTIVAYSGRRTAA